VLATFALSSSEDEAVDVHAQSVATAPSGWRRRLIVLVAITSEGMPANKSIAVTSTAALKALHP